MATRANNDGIQLNLGTISLPVMACVLAAVLLTSSNDKPPPKVAAADKVALEQLEPQVPAFKKSLDLARKRIEDHAAMLSDKDQIESRITDIELEIARSRKTCDELKKNVSEAQERAALLASISGKAVEMSALSNEISKVVSDIKAVANRIELVGMDEFPRPYVSIECKGEDATVYVPGQSERILRPPMAKGAELSGTDQEWLRKQVVEVKAVVVFARQASFENCYMKFFSAILNIQREEEKRNKNVAIAFVPIQDHEDIAGHILRGGNRDK
jgi:hypothetical protein